MNKLLLFFLFTCIVSTTATTYQLTEKDNHANIHIDKTDNIIISLRTNPTTGYHWEIQYNTELLLIEKDVTIAEDHPEGMVGYSSKREIHLHPTTTSGTCVITLNYRRPWETSKQPINSMSYTITIN